LTFFVLIERRPKSFGNIEKNDFIDGGFTFSKIVTSSSPTSFGFLPRASSTLSSVPNRLIASGN
jgi:hypothetical protein